jgi:hypothetical protein
MGKTVARTSLTYSYDPRNKSSCHDYIDSRASLLCIVKTVKGAYLASYYSGAYAEKTVMNDPGLLVSLNNGEVFRLNPQGGKITPRGMVHDKYYIIFGNSELRLKVADREVYSNFGVNNSYFNNRGLAVDALLGEGSNRQTTFESMEMYEVKFSEEQSEKRVI